MGRRRLDVSIQLPKCRCCLRTHVLIKFTISGIDLQNFGTTFGFKCLLRDRHREDGGLRHFKRLSQRTRIIAVRHQSYGALALTGRRRYSEAEKMEHEGAHLPHDVLQRLNDIPPFRRVLNIIAHCFQQRSCLVISDNRLRAGLAQMHAGSPV